MADTEQEVKIIERNGDYGWRGRDRWACGDDPLSWREYRTARDYERELMDKEHALNMSEMRRISDEHDIELYKQIRSEIKAVDDKLEREVRRIDEVNAVQRTYNATQTAAIGSLQHQVNELMHITRRVVPNSSICPGWGGVNVTPDIDFPPEP